MRVRTNVNVRPKFMRAVLLAVILVSCRLPMCRGEELNLSWSGFLGGSSEDEGLDLACDSSGYVYVTGKTLSVNFPNTSGVFQENFQGISDAFVTKTDPSGTSLVYSTYLGGAHWDLGHGIAVDSSGCACVTGYTYSSDFPVVSGAYDENHNGGCDVFIAKLNPTGIGLEGSTLLGGSAGDYGYAIALDSAGYPYVTGNISSSNFPISVNAFADEFGGINDVFIARFNATLATLEYSTYLGGSNGEVAYGLAVDSAGCAYVAGCTESTDFPITSGAFDALYEGIPESFVVKLNSSGSGLEYSTFLGGSDSDYCQAIALDSAGCAYVCGRTNSSNFPITSGSYDETYNWGWDTFVSKLNPSGNGLVYSTFLGGNGVDNGVGIDVDPIGRVAITGETTSVNFPVTPGAYDENHSGNYDAFMAVLSPGGSELEYATYLGGNNYELGYAVAFNPAGAVHVTGRTESADFPATAGSFDVAFNGGVSDGFVAKFTGGYNLSGTVVCKYPGWTKNTAPVIYQVRQPGVPPTPPLYSGTIAIAMTPGNPAGGSFTVADVPDGTYDVALKHVNHIADMRSGVVVAGGDVTGLGFSLWAGDADGDNNFNTVCPTDRKGDNNVDIKDYYTLYYQYQKSKPVTAGFNADFNGDGTVGLLDYNGLKYGYLNRPNPGNWYAP